MKTTLAFTVLMAVGFLNSIEGKSIPTNMAFLGTLKAKSLGFDARNYYVVTNAAPWSNAEADCKSVGGELVSVNTEEERDGLNRFLETHGSGGTYWTSGIYDQTSGVYRWGDGEVFGEFIKWAPGQPDNRFPTATRVAFSHTNRFSSALETRTMGQPERYICEVPVAACTTPNPGSL